jgi:murein DD-endopeptidase MepM/ murein hydrolase activator NlpD
VAAFFIEAGISHWVAISALLRFSPYSNLQSFLYSDHTEKSQLEFLIMNKTPALPLSILVLQIAFNGATAMAVESPSTEPSTQTAAFDINEPLFVSGFQDFTMLLINREEVITDAKLFESDLESGIAATVNTISAANSAVSRNSDANIFSEGDILSGLVQDQTAPISFTFDQNFKIAFPLHGYTPYTAPISAVFDHHMTEGNCGDKIITAYTGEQGLAYYGHSSWSYPATGSTCAGGRLFEFAQKNMAPFSINGQYIGGKYLAYDGHTGFDYPVPLKTPIYATADGTLRLTRNDYNEIMIDHWNGYTSHFLHCSFIFPVADGRTVKKGDLIGYSGDTAVKGHPHLHYTIKKDGIRIDPYGWTGNYKDPYQMLNRSVVNIKMWE